MKTKAPTPFERAMLSHAAAQTEFLFVIAHYYCQHHARPTVEAIPSKLLDELRETLPVAAELYERLRVPPPKLRSA